MKTFLTGIALLAAATSVTSVPVETGRRVSFMPEGRPSTYHMQGTLGVTESPLMTTIALASKSYAPLSIGQTSAKHRAITYAKDIMAGEGFTEEATFIVKDSYTDEHNGVTHVYLRQTLNGLQIFNADFNINVDTEGQLLSFSNGFMNPENAAIGVDGAVVPKLTALEALTALYANIGCSGDVASYADVEVTAGPAPTQKTTLSGVPMALSDVNLELGYVQQDGGASVSFVWEMDVEMSDNWYNAFVDAQAGTVLGRVDWVSDASYNVYPLGKAMDPLGGDRDIAVNPSDAEASPNGWHDIGKGANSLTTYGNNVYAQNNPSGRGDYESNYRPAGTKSLIFNFPIDLKKDPKTYEDGSITNLFYWNNIVHDVFYKYGFTEKSGNFQKDNYGRGGMGNDFVIANAQDGSGTNNANFATPPDGRNGKMRMYVWTQSNPRRDGDLDSGIVVHEYGHGISTRLTGGPANSNCLGWGESGGMGEGWSDLFAVMFNMKKEYTRAKAFPMGEYAALKGIRQFPYSTDMKVNSDTYKSINKYYGVHPKGAVWANMLFEVYWNMVESYGFDADWHNASGTAGNTMLLQNVVDGMKLQPCRPTFITARDAILQADKVNFGGKNTCLIWKGFAKRGLGVKAAPRGKEDFSIPSTCESLVFEFQAFY